MNSKLKRRLPIFIVLIISVVIILFRPTTEWTQCSACGVQQIERGIARRIIDSWSVYELDEYGTYAEWKKLHPDETCNHVFGKVKHKSPATSLKELTSHEN